ncbi:MAG TPA: class I SAM-dependent methyltransferase [Gemmataceae bacterium]|nr:class I SAM-dependent methyltransferase [Gemmataceae bacterium]
MKMVIWAAMKTQMSLFPSSARKRSGAAVQAGGRSDCYYDQWRPEVAALVPPRCRRVLEVGCGAGEMGRLLVRRGHHVTGIELVPEMAERARRRLDRVLTADVEQDGFPFPPASFDALIFADVLEHLVDPWRVLREAVEVLADDGVVVASIPNVQNIDVLRRLLLGRWEYRERGIMDIGHLRFFTLSSIRALFAQANLTVAQVGHRYRRSWWRELLCWLTAGRARALWTRQYLVVGRPIPSRRRD